MGSGLRTRNPDYRNGKTDSDSDLRDLRVLSFCI